MLCTVLRILVVADSSRNPSYQPIRTSYIEPEHVVAIFEELHDIHVDALIASLDCLVELLQATRVLVAAFR